MDPRLGKQSRRPKLAKKDVDLLLAQTQFTRGNISQLFVHFVSSIPTQSHWLYTHDTEKSACQSDRRLFLQQFELTDDEYIHEALESVDLEGSLPMNFRNYCLGLEAIVTVGTPEDKVRLLFLAADHDGDGLIHLNVFCSILAYHIPIEKGISQEYTAQHLYTRMKSALTRKSLSIDRLSYSDLVSILTHDLKLLHLISINRSSLIESLIRRQRRKIEVELG